MILESLLRKLACLLVGLFSMLLKSSQSSDGELSQRRKPKFILKIIYGHNSSMGGQCINGRTYMCLALEQGLLSTGADAICGEIELGSSLQRFSNAPLASKVHVNYILIFLLYYL